MSSAHFRVSFVDVNQLISDEKRPNIVLLLCTFAHESAEGEEIDKNDYAYFDPI